MPDILYCLGIFDTYTFWTLDLFPSPVVREEMFYLVGREDNLDHWMETDPVSETLCI
jgi:hypothetical protein